jgi:hypothetical protein
MSCYPDRRMPVRLARAQVLDEGRLFAALTIAGVALVVALPVVPGHDVPQHLAYVKIIVAWQADPADLPRAFTVPDLAGSYATSYRLLALLAQKTSPETALRLALGLYVAGLALGVRRLVRATWGEDTSSTGAQRVPTTLLAPLVALNPVFCMGFVAYLLGLVPCVLGASEAVAFLRTGRAERLAVAAVCGAAAATIHAVAAAALVLVLVLVVLARRDRRAVVVAASVAVAAFASGAALGTGVRPGPDLHLARTLLDNVRAYGVLDGLVGTFRISFTSGFEKLGQVVASLLGPFPWREKVLVAVVAAFAVAVHHRSATDVATPLAARGVRPALGAFFLLAISAPAAIQVPDDLSLLDFRLITTATILCVAVLPRTAADAAPKSWRARLAIPVGVALALLLWARQLFGAASEVMDTVSLVERLGPRDRLLALPMHDASAYLDERNAVLHYAAVHQTARHGAVTSLFWGRFSPRLPVGYRDGAEPAHPPDWAPWMLREEELSGFSHLVVRWPEAEDDARLHELAARVERFSADERLRLVACRGASCLFAVAAVGDGELHSSLRP